jgi:diguanylate cyclase (GGDEF)-like protein
MSVERWTATDRDDHYYWLTALLAARGARTATCRTIAAVALLLGAVQLMLLLTPAGPHGRTQQLMAIGVTVGSVLIGLCWLRSWWPTSLESKLCGVLAAACICVACLIQADPLLGLLVSTVFAVLNGITALLHFARVLVVTCTASAVTVAVLAVRLAQTDLVVALGGAVIVVVVNVFVVVTARMVLRMVDAGRLVGEIDPLTGLLNRRGFDDEFAMLIGARNRDDDRHVVVLVVDLDGFSAVTGMRGEVGGKWARVAVAQRLRETVRGAAILAHVDDAECLVADLFTTADPTPLAERVRGGIYAAPLRLTASIGAVSTPLRPLSGAAPPDVLDELLRIATAAMEDARRSGGNAVRQVLSPPLDVLGNGKGAA